MEAGGRATRFTSDLPERGREEAFRGARRVVRGLAAGLVLLVPGTAPAAAQDANIKLHPDTIEARLAEARFELRQAQDTRFEGDRTQQALLAFPGGSLMLVKWARAPRGGGEFNNRPRYELAAYRLQKLFLSPEEFVVPPTVVRCFPLAWYRTELEERAPETFSDTGHVMVALQYWLWGVTADDVFDEDRFESDSVYARHLANVNVLTYLIRHRDANEGNFVISEDPGNPRVFAVDNGVSFRSERSNRGDEWRRLRVDRLPRRTVERLRRLTREELERRLGVLVQFELRGGRLVTAEPGENLDPGDGIRRRDGVIQLGLTRAEISDVWDRLRNLLEDVDEGDLGVF